MFAMVSGGLFLLFPCVATAQDASVDSNAKASGYVWHRDIGYREQAADQETQAACRLDLYVPASTTQTSTDGFATVVWFHGGGLKSGKREVPKPLRESKVGVVAVDYRLTPKVTVKDCIDDAAASVAWTLEHIEEYGGNKSKVFVSGHSAGGYLTSMVGFDPTWLAKHSRSPDDLAGLIPLSGHTITHFTARAERGIEGTQPIIDELAPLFHLHADAPPTLLITGDRELEMLGRYEENAYFWRMLQVVKHPDATLYELDGYNHGQMVGPALPLVLRFMREHTKK